MTTLWGLHIIDEIDFINTKLSCFSSKDEWSNRVLVRFENATQFTFILYDVIMNVTVSLIFIRSIDYHILASSIPCASSVEHWSSDASSCWFLVIDWFDEQNWFIIAHIIRINILYFVMVRIKITQLLATPSTPCQDNQ